MFNYENLDDVEFEELCKDILEKTLNTKLRIFAKGKDGGVDLTDNVNTHDVVVQVKHYKKSSFSNLKASLNNEVPKIKKLNPIQYYICCSKELSDPNIKEIYNIFSEYMSSDKNIFTLKEIDYFLQDPKHIDIVRKHFKLWLSASNILSEINNQNIFIDCETLLADIKEEYKYYIQTSSYNECVNTLEKYRAVMLIGAPGVGKTVTSKMLILYFANQGYRVRYTTNGDISNIKNSLSTDKDKKEIILLDDCLGQYYFRMNETQENELISIIKYVKLNPKKLIILNSRVTIFNEAQEHSIDFHKFINNKNIGLHTINMDNISLFEKARIFYNHLVHNHVPQDYYSSVRNDKKYIKIVSHKNYNPRIIEFVTLESRYKLIKPDNYFNFIIDNLNNSRDVWKNEFNCRLQKIDRIFMYVLYSLTDTTINYDVFKECFNYRLRQYDDIDFTIDNFEIVLSRLNKSLVRIVDNKGKNEIGVLNPSVNDYMQSIFYSNTNELEIARKAIIYYTQLERCYKKEEFIKVTKKMVLNGRMHHIKTIPSSRIQAFTIYKICEYNILMDTYKDIIFEFLKHVSADNTFGQIRFEKSDIVKCLLSEPLFNYYNVIDQLYNMTFIKELLSNLYLNKLVSFINNIYEIIKNQIELGVLPREIEDEYIDVSIDLVNDEIDDYISEFDISDFCEQIDINEILNQSEKDLHPEKSQYNQADFMDMVVDNAIDVITELVELELKEGINKEINSLNSNIEIFFINDDLKSYIDIEEIKRQVNYIIDPQYDEDLEYERWSNNQYSDGVYLDDIDIIFDREID